MKKTIVTFALVAVLGSLAVSCQKENIVDQTSIVAENGSIYKVRYSIDGTTHHFTIVGYDAWHDFLNWMLALAEEGHRVSFQKEDVERQTDSAKTTVVYTTTNHDDAYKWVDKMSDEGYEVTVEFDSRTGIYTCTAIRPDNLNSQSDTTEIKRHF